jgi:hypothetical protein
MDNVWLKYPDLLFKHSWGMHQIIQGMVTVFSFREVMYTYVFSEFAHGFLVHFSGKNQNPHFYILLYKPLQQIYNGRMYTSLDLIKVKGKAGYKQQNTHEG